MGHHHHHHLLPVCVFLVASVFSSVSAVQSLSQEGRNQDSDPMLAAESSGVRYDSMPILSRRYFELMKRSAISPLLTPTHSNSAHPQQTRISPRAASSAFFTKLAYEPEKMAPLMDQQKAASEYWGSSHEEDAGGFGGSMDSMEQEPYEQSYGHGGGGGGGRGYGHGGNGGGYGHGGGYHSKHDMSGYMRGKEITITPDHKPITLHYRTHSQPIMVHQTRIPGPKPEVKYTKSHEEPHRVVHEVVRPIIQEVKEVIQPYRRVTQEIRPVQEEIRTLVAKSSGHGGGGGEGGGGGGMSYGKGGGMSYGGMSSESKPQLYQKAAAPLGQYEPSPSESHQTMSLPASNVPRRSKVFLKNGVPVYQSNYMGPALPVMSRQ